MGIPRVVSLVVILVVAGCRPQEKPSPSGQREPGDAGDGKILLSKARTGFATKHANRKSNEPVPDPPAKLFRKVKYTSPVGELAAYLTPDPRDGKKHPAIIWITGGICNDIGDVWSPAPAGNDQTARQYREAGIVMMFPSFRGGNDNPGFQEGFFGEVDDVIAAAEFLAKQDYVDAKRIYLGGHSTGGTLAMLVAACTDRFRAVFSFGPADNVLRYGIGEYTPFDTRIRGEVILRSPVRWLHSIQSPTFVFEGTHQANADALMAMAMESKNPKVFFYPVKGADHFSLLAPLNKLIAVKIAKDAGEATNLAFMEAEVNQVAGK